MCATSNRISTGFNWPVSLPVSAVVTQTVTLFVFCITLCISFNHLRHKFKKTSYEQVAVLRLKYISAGTAVSLANFLYTGTLLPKNANS